MYAHLRLYSDYFDEVDAIEITESTLKRREKPPKTSALSHEGMRLNNTWVWVGSLVLKTSLLEQQQHSLQKRKIVYFIWIFYSKWASLI